MEINCNVIKDILPLYADDLVCTETKGVVEAHLDCCESCKQTLKAMRFQPQVGCEAMMAGMKRVSTEIHKAKVWTVTTAVLLVVTVAVSLIVFLTFPVWASAEDAIEKVECLDDGSIKVYFTEQCGGIISTGRHGDHGILCNKVRWDGLFSRNLPDGMNDASYGHFTIIGNTVVDGETTRFAKDNNLWYINSQNGTADTLIWNSGDAAEGIQMLEMSYILLMVVVCVAAAFAVTALAGILLRNRPCGLAFQNRAAVFGSFCLSSLIVTSGKFMVYEEFWMKMSVIAILTVLMSATVLCWLHLSRLKK